MTHQLAILSVFLSLVLASGAGAQEPPEQEPPPTQEAEGEEAPFEGEVAEEDFDDIENILEGDEAVLAGSGYTYDPGDRRDPFRSLLSAPDRAEFLGPRPEGIPGMLIEELEVAAIYLTPEGPLAQVQTANKTISYLLRPGDQLFDGDVVDIRYEKGSVAEVIFKQLTPDDVKQFREIVKKLNP